MHVFLATDLTALAQRPPSDDPDDVEEQAIEVVPLAVASLPAAFERGEVRDARTIAAITVALAAPAGRARRPTTADGYSLADTWFLTSS